MSIRTLQTAQHRNPGRHAHAPILKAPYYADPQDGTVLHRYMDERFVTRFLNDAVQERLTGSSRQPWRREDRFGKHAGDRVCLRQAVHRTFYMVCCEICCDQPGQPAFDPARIVSAGMVVRRGGERQFASWQVRDDRAIGWTDTPIDQAELDPDQHRRLLKRSLVKAQQAPLSYSGEKTHPLQAKVVQSRDAAGRTRNRTLLFGYLPLSGALEAKLDGAGSHTLPAVISAAGVLAETEWPFGSWDGESDDPTCDCVGSPMEVARDVCGHFKWTAATGLQIRNGVPSSALVRLLKILLERYRVQDESVDDNEVLRIVLSQWRLYRNLDPRYLALGDLAELEQGQHFLDFLTANADALLTHLADYASGEDVAPATVRRLPGLDAGLSLYLTEEQAALLREVLVLRTEKAQTLIEAELPLPRYTQDANAIYHLRPFIRYQDDCGCERIAWGPASDTFRVASVLDPEATRPSVVQLPELADVKRGFARGVTFLTPKSMADKLAQMTPDMGMGRSGRKNHTNLGFMLSFSIPVITLCAMSILMVLINVLNLFMGWLPWAVLKIPRRIG